MDVAEKWSQHWDALDDDGANDFGGVPDIRVCVAPKVPFILRVAAVFPASSDCGDDGDDHSQAHGQAETDLFDFSHIQIPGNEPWEGSHDEIHDDVIYCMFC